MSIRLFVIGCLWLFCTVAGANDIRTRTLVVGSEYDYPPFSIGQSVESADGFTVDLWEVVARDAGVKYTLRVQPFHRLLEEFRDGKIDVLVNLAQSDERRKFADFTVPHVTVHGAIFIRDGTPGLRGEADLIGKSVIVVNADIAHEYATTREWGKNLVLVPTAAEGLRLLESGQHDAMFVSKLVGMQTLQHLKISTITTLPVTGGATQKFSFAVKKGDAELLALLNEGLALSKSGGAYDRLYEKWFSVYEEKEVPPLRDMLRYLLPLLALFIGYVLLTYYNRHRERRRAIQVLEESHHMLQTVIDAMPMRVFWKDRESRFLGCNTLFANDAGESSPSGVVGKLDSELAWKGAAALYQREDQEVMASGQARLAVDVHQATVDGTPKWLRTYKVPLHSVDQRVTGVLGVYSDITEAKETERALIESEYRLSEILENVSACIYLKDRDGRYLFANKPVRELLNLPAEEIIGFGDEKFFDAATAANIRKNDRRVLENGEVIRREETNHIARSGAKTTYWSVKLPLRSEHGEIYALCGISTDLTEIKRGQEEMQLASMVYESSSEAMMVTDAEGNIITINPAFVETTGYTLDEVRGRNAGILRSHGQASAFFDGLSSQLSSTGYWQGEIAGKRKNGEAYPKWMTINTAFNADGTPFRRIVLFSDITEKKKAEAVIWQQANFDALTGLPNRRMFHDRLEREIKLANRSNGQLALLFIDLDRFKDINDTLGHGNGDALLVEAARRLRSCVRDLDTVARIGGDEFTIILGGLDDTHSVDRTVQGILKSMEASFALGAERAYVSASIGITYYPQDATEIETLLKNADQAMYMAKQLGRNRCCYFTQSMDQAAKSRVRLSNDLRIALEQKQFWIAYQPIVELATGAVHKAEALLRWQHPVLGLVSPAEFIPIAEETGAIVDIGNWVLTEAASQVLHWRRTLDATFQLSVNKSPMQFLDRGANPKRWLDIVKEIDLPPQSIVVEITEGVLLDANPAVDSRLAEFRHHGIQIAIDDFGTGYSSLAYLKRFNIDYLKIDRAFVQNLTYGTKDLALCEAIIVMAHKLGIRVIAEGVETREQCDLLIASGCDYAQGYFFSRPVAAPEFEAWLAQHIETNKDACPIQ